MQISLALSFSLHLVFLLCVQLHTKEGIQSSVLIMDNYVVNNPHDDF